METGHVFETAKDAGGASVIEAFLSSNASRKQKHRLVVKNICSLKLPVLHPWKLTMSLKQQKMQEEHVLLKPFLGRMLLESRNPD
ncbi:hypothetical protein Q3G72_009015 [Acer saccharum]|nr:hypothetical protein Q3G72_009015 [Acer saccharum]